MSKNESMNILYTRKRGLEHYFRGLTRKLLLGECINGMSLKVVETEMLVLNTV